MTIIDKTSENRFAQNVDDWDRYDGDTIISIDPQERLRTDTYVVSTIDADNAVSVTQRGLFWDKEDAVAFARKIGLPEHRLAGAEPRTQTGGNQ